MQRRESTIIRGSSVIPSRITAMRGTQAFQPMLESTDEEGGNSLAAKEARMNQRLREMQIKEKIITVTFDSHGPLYLMLQSN